MTTKTRHQHQAITTHRDASGGGYTQDRCRCGAVRTTAWSRHARDEQDGAWIAPCSGTRRHHAGCDCAAVAARARA